MGDGFNYAGNTFTTTAQFDHPTADLTLWRVGGTFSSYAPLYTGTDEVGKSLVLFGRGAVRGAEVNVAGASPTDLRGWRWGDTGGASAAGARTRWIPSPPLAGPTISWRVSARTAA